MRALTLVVCLAGLSSNARAEDRALLVGVGRSRLPKQNLSGIPSDLRMMRRAAQLMGFRPHQVLVLQDDKATHAAVVSAIRDHLVRGVGAGDRVLLYFSGHGSQVPDQDGDEADGADEVWVLTDEAVPEDEPGDYLLDDELRGLLAQIPTKRVAVVVDACHSGTSTRAPGLVPRFLPYRGRRRAATGTDDAPELEGHRVVIAAARDDETALDTPSGGLFTRGLYAAILRADRRGLPVTPLELTDAAATYIRGHLRPRDVYHPRLSAPEGLARQPLFSTASGRPVAREAVQQLARRFAGELKASSDRSSYRRGEQMVLEIEVPAPGHINIISVDAHDRATVLFPNVSHPSNRVAGGKLQIPSADMGFSVVAVPPTGRTLVVVLFSARPFRLPGVGAGSAFRQLDLERLQPGALDTSSLGRTAAGSLNVQVRR